MRLRAGLTVALAVGVAVFGLAAAAQAHVTVDPDTATQGGYTRVAFRVPTESDTASTTKVDLFLDPDHPVASVTTMPVPGWTVAVVTKKLATPLTDDDGNQIDNGRLQRSNLGHRDPARLGRLYQYANKRHFHAPGSPACPHKRRL